MDGNLEIHFQIWDGPVLAGFTSKYLSVKYDASS